MVTAVLALLAGMAVPHLQRIKITSQEKVALASLRTIFSAQATHHARFQLYGDMNALVSNEFLDDSLASGSKSGYSYTIGSVDASQFTAVAVPIEQGVSGEKGFYIDATGVIRFTDDGSPPTAASPPWR